VQYLESKDLSKLFRVMSAENKTHHLVALTSFFCGSRISQTLAIRGSDVFLREGRWVIKIRAAKRGDIGFKTLHADSQPAFDMTPLVALAKARGTSLIFGGTTRQYFNLCLKKYAKLAGVHSDFAHSHVLRHSAAMVIWDETQRLGAVSKFLQHRSPSSAMAYLQEVDGVTAQAAMDNFKFEEAA
jgi:integrase